MVARRHSTTMANLSRLHHNPDFGTQITGWHRVSENVGAGPSIAPIHRALMNSDGHRRNIMDDRVCGTLNFRRLSTTTSRFRDVSGEQGRDVEALAAAGLTTGCDTNRFRPIDPVTRAQTASMIDRNLRCGAVRRDRPTVVSVRCLRRGDSAHPQSSPQRAVARAHHDGDRRPPASTREIAWRTIGLTFGVLAPAGAGIIYSRARTTRTTRSSRPA